MSLEIFKIYNNNEVSIDKFEVVHEGVFGNIRIEPYIIKNTDNVYSYKTVKLEIIDLTNDAQDDFIFKIIKSEIQPDEELWDGANNTFTIPLINKSNEPQNVQFKFWVRTYVQAGVAPQKYSNKLKFKLSYEMEQ